ncbi:hypothetical protein HRbin33_01383 [bacterium HR33]|nr:hypothetical protein HRbin33_01383 [bacterium HR33]
MRSILAASFFLVLVLPVRVHAQASGRPTRMGTLVAVVKDSRNGELLVGAVIEVLGTEITAHTNRQGLARLAGIPPGVHRVRARRIGYRPKEHVVEVTAEPVQTLELTLLLEPAPVQLAPVEVAGERIEHLELAGFYERRALGFGSFLTRAEFEKWEPRITTDVLRRLPGIRVRINPNWGKRGDNRRFLVESHRGAVRISKGTCPPLFFLDGAYIGDADGLDIDEVVSVTHLEAVEAYVGGGGIPARFNRTGAACGVIVLWTR